MDPSAIIGAGVGAGTSGIFGVINNSIALQREQQARRENYLYNEAAANNADKRTRALYNDFYSPEALLRQYQEAGLSPSMMFGGTPGQGGMSGAQGAGVNQPSTFMPISLLEGAQIAKLAAETANIKADTKNKTGEGAIGAAEIAQMLADAGNKKAATCLIMAQADAQELQNYITDKTKDFSIQTAEHQANIFRNEADRTYWAALNSNLEFDFNQETYTNRVKEVELNVVNLCMDMIQKDKNIQLTEAQTAATRASIQQMWKTLELKAQEIANMKTSIDNQKKYWDESIELAKKGLTINKWDIGVKAVTSIISGAIQGAFLYAIKGAKVAAGAAKGTTPVFMTPQMQEFIYGKTGQNYNTSFY